MTIERNIFAIVVTYNGMQWIERCLKSLETSTVAVKTIVVDNGSTDDTLAYIHSHYPATIVLPQKENLGFGQGNNAGMAYAMAHQASHVLLLNQDAWIAPDMLEQLLPYDDGNSLLSPIHLNGEGDALDKNFKHNALLRSYALQQLIDDWATGHTTRYATYEINAACWLLPRTLLKEIGGFNPMFFHYAEDVNYLDRLHYHQKGVYFIPNAKVYHDRANVKEKPLNKQYMYQQLLLRQLNINYSLFFAKLQIWRFAVGMIHTAFSKRKLSYIRLLWQARIQLNKATTETKTNRLMQQTFGAHWINK